MKPRVIKRERTILESPDGWLCKHSGRKYRTALRAWQAICRADARDTYPGLSVVTTVNWEPTTTAGGAEIAQGLREHRCPDSDPPAQLTIRRKVK
jgi:hypothetical protein